MRLSQKLLDVSGPKHRKSRDFSFQLVHLNVLIKSNEAEQHKMFRRWTSEEEGGKREVKQTFKVKQQVTKTGNKQHKKGELRKTKTNLFLFSFLSFLSADVSRNNLTKPLE